MRGGGDSAAFALGLSMWDLSRDIYGFFLGRAVLRLIVLLASSPLAKKVRDIFLTEIKQKKATSSHDYALLACPRKQGGAGTSSAAAAGSRSKQEEEEEDVGGVGGRRVGGGAGGGVGVGVGIGAVVVEQV